MFNVYAPNAEGKTDEEIQSFYDKLEDIVQASRVVPPVLVGEKKETKKKREGSDPPLNEKRNSF
jgi:hypothetical protein